MFRILHWKGYKGISGLLNVLGLGASFAAFLILMMKVSYELNYDKFHPQSDRIFRLELLLNEGNTTQSIVPRGLADAFISANPRISYGTLVLPAFLGETYFTVEENDAKTGFRSEIAQVYPQISDVFGFKIKAGNPHCLESPDQVMIPASIAEMYFGRTDPIGEIISCEEGIWGKSRGKSLFTIGAVYEDLPENTLLTNLIYVSIDPTFQINDFGSCNFICYVKLDSPRYAQEVCDHFNELYNVAEIGGWQEKVTVSLSLLSDIYFRESGSKDTVNVLFIIAMLVIIIAAINFTNFATAMVPVRIKSINTKKILGSSSCSLRLNYLLEAVAICMFAFLIALTLVFLADELHMLTFISADIRINYNLKVIFITAGIALATGVVAGLWPACYITSFPPALVLKGSFGLSLKGRKLRTVLIGFQYIVSFCLIIAAICMQQQNKYLRKFNLGFNTRDIAVVELSKSHLGKRDFFINRLKSKAMVQDVAFAMTTIGTSDSYRSEGAGYRDGRFNFSSVSVSWNFLQVLDIPLLEGRYPTENEENGQAGILLLNQTAALNEGIYAGESVNYERGSYIAAVFRDINLFSLRKSSNNLAFVVGDPYSDGLPVAYIRLVPGADRKEATAFINEVLKQVDNAYPFEINYYDRMLDVLYAKEANMNRIISLFGFLAIIISVAGIFGLVMFETQYRRKEIGIRKIFGAEVTEIIRMFNRVYIKIMIVSCVLAVPISYYAVSQWLSRFAYRTPIHWWIFFVAFVLIAAITVITVTLRNWSAANENPVESIVAS